MAELRRCASTHRRGSAIRNKAVVATAQLRTHEVLPAGPAPLGAVLRHKLLVGGLVDVLEARGNLAAGVVLERQLHVVALLQVLGVLVLRT
jgi:hypothetical protein